MTPAVLVTRRLPCADRSKAPFFCSYCCVWPEDCRKLVDFLINLSTTNVCCFFLFSLSFLVWVQTTHHFSLTFLLLFLLLLFFFIFFMDNTQNFNCVWVWNIFWRKPTKRFNYIHSNLLFIKQLIKWNSVNNEFYIFNIARISSDAGMKLKNSIKK